MSAPSAAAACFALVKEAVATNGGMGVCASALSADLGKGADVGYVEADSG